MRGDIIIKKFINGCMYKMCHNKIILNSWCIKCGNRLKHRNFGDELNFYLIEALTGLKAFNYTDLPGKLVANDVDYLCIGSIIEDFATPHSIIWGAGMIDGVNKRLINKPLNVRAVRGRLTQKHLIENGVECPDVFGDPALLTPLIYKPAITKKYGVGIIPHVSELNHKTVERMVAQGAHLIDFSNYTDWHALIDDICNCETIASSSLHGLILSDAYGIPNVWIKITGSLLGGDFKFNDYNSAVRRSKIEALVLNDSTTLDEVKEQVKNYTPIEWDHEPLLNAAPWPIKVRF